MIIGISGKAKSGKDTAADFLVKNHGFVKIALADEMKRIFLSCFPKTPLENLWGPSSLRNEPIYAYPREHGPWAVDAEGIARCACCDSIRASVGDSVCYLTARFGLQRLGTEWGRECYLNVWVDRALDAANKVLRVSGILRSLHFHYTPYEGLIKTNVPVAAKPRGVVISDVRWPNGNEGRSIIFAGGVLWRMLRGEGLGGSRGQHESEKSVEDAPENIFGAVIDNRESSLEELEAAVTKLASQGFVDRKGTEK